MPSFVRPFVGWTLHKFGGVLEAQVNPNRSFSQIIAQGLICEDATQAPDPHVKSIVEHVGETVDEIPASFLKIQRDEMTEY